MSQKINFSIVLSVGCVILSLFLLVQIFQIGTSINQSRAGVSSQSSSSAARCAEGTEYVYTSGACTPTDLVCENGSSDWPDCTTNPDNSSPSEDNFNSSVDSVSPSALETDPTIP